MKVEKDYSWSTHQPILNMIMTIFKPELVVELGSGEYSTPLLMSYNPKEYICIENGKEWYDHMLNKFDFLNEHNYIYHSVGPSDKLYKQLSREEKDSIIEYYTLLSDRIDSYSLNPKFIFVDQYTCCRTLSINLLYKNFDIIAYHDCEPAGVLWYEYKFDNNLINNYDTFCLKTPKSWAGCFVHKKYSVSENNLKTAIAPFIKEYCLSNSIAPNTIFLEKK